MEHAMDLRAAVNPTFLTAQQTLFMLSAAGNEDAKRMIAELGITNQFLKNDDGQDRGRYFFSEEEGKLLMTGVTLSIEGRYSAVSRELLSGNWRNMLDIACGYTPRAMFCQRAGIDYVGVDVPVVTERLSVLDGKLFKDRKHPTYVGGDATNAASLLAAADLMEGELFVSSEGLLLYFSRDEMLQFTSALRRVLKKHGGAWYSTDPGVDYTAFATCLLRSEDAKEKYAASKAARMRDADVYNTDFSREERMALIRTSGFRMEPIPFFRQGRDTLRMLRAVPAEMRDRILSVLEDSYIYRMTPDPDYRETDPIGGAKQAENLTIRYTADGGVLKCQVSGRVDTLSAPALLQVLEENVSQVKAVTLEADDLEYISSAGLRVLLMAVKRLGAGTVRVTGVRAAVKEIFETTGFSRMIDVEGEKNI